jgi:hypothetical protein
MYMLLDRTLKHYCYGMLVMAKLCCDGLLSGCVFSLLLTSKALIVRLFGVHILYRTCFLKLEH